MAWTWTGALSTKRSECRASHTAWRSAVLRARDEVGRRRGVVRERRRYRRGPTRPPSVVLVVGQGAQGDPQALGGFLGSRAWPPPASSAPGAWCSRARAA